MNPPNPGFRHRYRQQLTDWLNEADPFRYWISLASNDPYISVDRMRGLLRAWDARLNRRMLGPQWAKRDTRLFYVACLEKPRRNPHCHLLARLSEPDVERRLRQEGELAEHAARVWKSLIRSGSTNVQRIRADHGRVASYAAKELLGDTQIEFFVIAREFWRA